MHSSVSMSVLIQQDFRSYCPRSLLAEDAWWLISTSLQRKRNDKVAFHWRSWHCLLSLPSIWVYTPETPSHFHKTLLSFTFVLKALICLNLNNLYISPLREKKRFYYIIKSLEEGKVGSRVFLNPTWDSTSIRFRYNQAWGAFLNGHNTFW